jgi:predicted 3-demethylubiquinone-9 3-methyltransferase (glyoxalase superfamily)
MQKVTPFLWFEGNAEQAAQFYISIFKNSKILSASPMTVTLELEGQRLMILNGGPHYRLTPAVSLFVHCETQLEINDLWAKLTADGGADGRCGWLVDKYGLSWQLVPPILGALLGDKDGKSATGHGGDDDHEQARDFSFRTGCARTVKPKETVKSG